MENKTIVQIANYSASYKGNFIASLEELDKKLQDFNNRTVYIFPEPCKYTKWIDQFMQIHTVYFVKSPKKKYKLFYDKELIKSLKWIFLTEKPAIVHSHFDGYDEYCVKANIANSEIVWHKHNSINLVSNYLKQLYQRMSFMHQYAIIGKKVHIIILYKEFEQFLRKFGYSGEVFILPNGILEDRIEFYIKEREDTIQFLAFGGRSDDKGLDLLLKSLPYIKKKTNKSFIINITEGADTRECINRIFPQDIPDEICIIPQTENVSDLFKRVDCFLAPSRRETFSYAVAEAMLSGTPAIVSDLEAVSWAFSQKSIITFESENIEDLTNKVVKYMECAWGGHST